MTRSATAIAGLALAALLGTVAAVGEPDPAPAVAQSSDRYAKIELNHDGIKTWVTINAVRRTITCVKVRTQDTGWTRTLTLKVDGITVLDRYTFRKGTSTRCLTTRKVIKRSSRSPIYAHISENMPGPLNPSDTAKEILR